MQRKERSLLFLERTLAGDGTQPFNGVFAIRIKGEINPADLSNAFGKIQRKHPQLQMAIADIKEKRPYFFVPTEISPIPLVFLPWKHEDEWQEQSLLGLRHQFNLECGPLMQAVCLHAEGLSDLIITFHHCICDGGGGVLLLHELLEILNEPALSIGKHDRLLDYQDIVPKDILKQKKIHLKTALLAGLVKSALTISSPFISKGKSPLSRLNDYIIHKKLSQELTGRWIKKCKEASITVNTATGLLMLKAYQHVQGNESKNKISCPVDIRRFAAQITNDQLFSFGLVLTLSREDKKEKNFWEEAAKLQANVDKQTKKLRPYEFLMTFERLHSALPNMLNMLTYGKVGNDMMFSNIGKIGLKEKYGKFEIETVFSPMVIGPFANPSTLICSTFKNKLDFSFVSNEAFLSQTQATQLIDYLCDKINLLTDK
jgi:NRPS condensation-like uncharacterized protein